jgi:virulence-associated protein VapD
MYAIAFDINQAALRLYYKGPYHQHAYDDIRRELAAHGFKPQQGSLYFGGSGTTPVTCVMAVQSLRDRFPWFQPSVTDLRMLRIDENNDLMPAIGQGRLPLDKSDAA